MTPTASCAMKGEHLPSVVVLDGEFRNCHPCYRGNVIYLSTFSKILAPGLRLAWVIAPPEVIRKLVQAKQGADLHTSTFNQMVAHEVAHGGFLDRHIQVIRDVYRERRDVMLAAMDR
jgi:2-aminoadipate transaminase